MLNNTYLAHDLAISTLQALIRRLEEMEIKPEHYGKLRNIQKTTEAFIETLIPEEELEFDDSKLFGNCSADRTPIFHERNMTMKCKQSTMNQGAKMAFNLINFQDNLISKMLDSKSFQALFSQRSNGFASMGRQRIRKAAYRQLQSVGYDELQAQDIVWQAQDIALLKYNAEEIDE